MRRYRPYVLVLMAFAASSITQSIQAAQLEQDGLHVRVGAYNVSFFSEASANEIGTMLNSFNLDVVGLTEVPRAPATGDLAAAMQANHFVAGTISSGQSDDKLKSIVSHSSLSPMSEIDLSAAQGGFVGGGESATHANTQIAGIDISIYCLHISDGVLEPMQKLLSDPGFVSDDADAILVIGDFNAKLTDPQMQLLMDQGFRPSWSDLNIDISHLKTYDFIPGRGPNGQDRDEGVIDHIMFKGQGILAVEGGIVPAMTAQGNPMSDHAMIWAELVITTIPEPSNLTLIGIGSIGLLRTTRRRRFMT